MKRFKPLIILTVFLMLLSFSGIANAITPSERDELNRATPGTQKVGLGTIISGLVAVGVRTYTTPDTSVNHPIPVSVEPSGDTGYVRTISGSLGGFGSTLPDGAIGQIMTLALTSDGGGDWVVTPDTSSGFRAITFADAGDVATLKFIDSEVGWVVVGTADASVGPVLTAPSAIGLPGFK